MATEKEQAVERLRDWIRTKAAAAGVGNTVKWGDYLKFRVSASAGAPDFSGVYDYYPINSDFPTDVYVENAPVTYSDGDTVLGNAVVSGFVSVAGITAGMLVRGAGIPADTLVLSTSTGIVTLSKAATATALNVELVFYPLFKGDNVQDKYDGTLDNGTLVDIAVMQDNRILYTIFVVDEDQRQRDICDTNSKELSRIMRRKILYARIKDILKYGAGSPPAKFPGDIF